MGHRDYIGKNWQHSRGEFNTNGVLVGCVKNLESTDGCYAAFSAVVKLTLETSITFDSSSL